MRKVNDSDGPLKTLKGFHRDNIAAGKTSEVVINLPFNSFESYDRVRGKMAVAAGDYEIMYGNSSDDKDLKVTKVTIQD